VTARRENIRRYLFAASLLIASSACSDADREPAANRPPGLEAPAPAASAPEPELADQPTGEQIARASATDAAREPNDVDLCIDGNANNRTGEDIDLARVILNGPAAFGGTREMIGWRDALSDQDVRDLIAHIRTLAAAAPAAPAGTPAS
jgi:hypothetical protein